jgi:hypothetical protein
MASFCVTIFDTIENPADNDTCFATSIKNLSLNKGSSYRIVYQLSKNSSSVNIIGYTLRGQIKPSSTSNIILLDMSTSNLLLKLDPQNSRIVMNIPESFTESISQSICYYYIELLNSGGEASRIIQGQINFNI